VSHHDGHGRLHQGPWQAQNHPGKVSHKIIKLYFNLTQT
jgi:hypothetical protein